MPSLISLLGSCLIAATAATAADRPSDPAKEQWWANPLTAASAAAGSKSESFGPPAVPKVAEITPSARTGQAAEFAPDPPHARRGDTVSVVFQDAGSDKDARPGTTKSREPGRADDDASTPPPPRRLPSNGTPSGTASSTPAETVGSLGLGSHNDKNSAGKISALSAMITVGGSLALVLGLFFIVAWAMRKTAPRGSLVLPKEVFEILGRAPLGARQQVQLLRCGNKLLLVSISPGGAETLTEVTDPLEVDRLAGICQQAHPKSATASFRQVFQQLAPKSGETPALDKLDPPATQRRRYRWEEKHA